MKKNLLLVVVVAFASLVLARSQFDAKKDNGFQDSLPELTAVGTFYEVGLKIGQTFKTQIQSFLADYSTLNQLLIPFSKTQQGQQVYQSLLTVNQKAFPNYFEELKGMSVGANVSLDNLYLLSFENEFIALSTNGSYDPISRDHCTDLSYEGNVHVMGHNEDANVLVKKYAYLVHVQAKDKSNHTVQDYIAYHYPAYLPGLFFGWNAHGLVFTENFLFPMQVNASGLANTFLALETYGARTLEEVIQILSRPNRAMGFSLNVGSVHDRRIANIEFSCTNVSTKFVVGNYSHTNLYNHMNTPQQPDPSSSHRDQRISELPPVKDDSDIREVLGDTKDPQYPIYRNGNPPDCCGTAASVLYDFNMRTASIYLSNPKSNPPYKTWRL